MLCTVGNRRIERAIPLVYSLWMVMLTALAMANALQAVNGVSVGILIAILAILSLSLKRQKGAEWLLRLRQKVLTPGLAVFALLAVALYFCCQPMVVWWADDIFYWALEPKGLWYLNGLTDHIGSIVYGFATYTPGMQVMQWQTLNIFGRFDESLLYYTLFLSYVIFLLPLCERISWKRWWAIPLVGISLIVLPLLSNALAYTFLCADTALAACFAFVLLILSDDKVDALALAAGLCGLTLLKQSGILLCVFALFFLLAKKREQRIPGHPQKKTLLLCWLAPLLTIGAWLIFCVAKPLEGAHDVHTLDSLGALVSGQLQLPASWQVMPGAFGYALTHWPTTERLLTALPFLPIPKLGWIALGVVFPLLMARVFGLKRMIRLSLTVLIGSALYLTVTLGSFVTTFNNEIASYTGENINNMSLLLERYLSPLLLGIGAVETSLAIGAFFHAKASVALRAGIACIAAALLVLTVNWGSVGDTLIPAGYQMREDTVSVADQTSETNFWADGFEDRVGATVLTGFSNDSEYMGNLDYTFAPARFQLPLRMNGDLETLKQDIRNRHITHIVCLDDANELYELASELTADGYMDTYTLYSVTDDGEEITLESVE